MVAPIEVSQRPAADGVCVYCRDDLPAAEALSCSGCGTTLHPDCWEALEACPTPGCDAVPAEATESAPLCARCQDPVEAAEGLLRCSDCGVAYDWSCWRELGRRCVTEGCEGRARAADLPPDSAGAAAPAADAASLAQVSTEADLDLDRFMKTGALIGFVVGLLGGFGYGGILAPRRDIDMTGGVQWALLALPLAAGGAAYGFLQALVGLRDPQPEGLGMVSSFLIVLAGTAAWFTTGSWLAVGFAALPTALVCGRLFGFNAGKTTTT